MFRLSTLPPPPSLEHVYTNERRLCTVVCRYVSLSVYQHPSLPCISSPGQPSSVRPLVYSAGENQGEDQKALPMLSFILVVLYVCIVCSHQLRGLQTIEQMFVPSSIQISLKTWRSKSAFYSVQGARMERTMDDVWHLEEPVLLPGTGAQEEPTDTTFPL